MTLEIYLAPHVRGVHGVQKFSTYTILDVGNCQKFNTYTILHVENCQKRYTILILILTRHENNYTILILILRTPIKTLYLYYTYTAASFKNYTKLILIL